MALITRLETKSVQRPTLHKPVARATYSIIELSKGKKVLQIDTYGSGERQIKDKVSQSLQLGDEAIAQLLTIMRSEF